MVLIGGSLKFALGVISAGAKRADVKRDDKVFANIPALQVATQNKFFTNASEWASLIFSEQLCCVTLCNTMPLVFSKAGGIWALRTVAGALRHVNELDFPSILLNVFRMDLFQNTRKQFLQDTFLVILGDANVYKVCKMSYLRS